MNLKEFQEKWNLMLEELEERGRLVRKVDPQDTTTKEDMKNPTNTSESSPTTSIGAIFLPRRKGRKRTAKKV